MLLQCCLTLCDILVQYAHARSRNTCVCVDVVVHIVFLLAGLAAQLVHQRGRGNVVGIFTVAIFLE